MVPDSRSTARSRVARNVVAAIFATGASGPECRSAPEDASIPCSTACSSASGQSGEAPHALASTRPKPPPRLGANSRELVVVRAGLPTHDALCRAALHRRRIHADRFPRQRYGIPADKQEPERTHRRESRRQCAGECESSSNDSAPSPSRQDPGGNRRTLRESCAWHAILRSQLGPSKQPRNSSRKYTPGARLGRSIRTA